MTLSSQSSVSNLLSDLINKQTSSTITTHLHTRPPNRRGRPRRPDQHLLTSPIVLIHTHEPLVVPRAPRARIHIEIALFAGRDPSLHARARGQER